MTSKTISTKVNFFTVISLSFAAILFGSTFANASCGKNYIKSGLGIFSLNSLSCRVQKFPNQVCYVASAQSNTQTLLTARCVLDHMYIWEDPGAFDFRVNIGFSSHIINLTIDQGNHCFEAKNGASGNTAFIFYRFCDTSKTSPFSKNEVKALLKDKNKFGSNSGVSSGIKSRKTDNNASKSSSSSSGSKINRAKATCTDLGFTPGTEKHGNCVLRVMDD